MRNSYERHENNYVIITDRRITLKISQYNTNKEDKIKKEEHRSKKAPPTTFYNRKHLKGWAKIPIPKQGYLYTLYHAVINNHDSAFYVQHTSK